MTFLIKSFSKTLSNKICSILTQSTQLTILKNIKSLDYRDIALQSNCSDIYCITSLLATKINLFTGNVDCQQIKCP